MVEKTDLESRVYDLEKSYLLWKGACFVAVPALLLVIGATTFYQIPTSVRNAVDQMVQEEMGETRAQVESNAEETTELTLNATTLLQEAKAFLAEATGDESAFSSFLNRKWCDLHAQREAGQEYTNDSDLPISVAITTHSSVNVCLLNVRVDGSGLLFQRNGNESRNKHCAATFTVPPGATYEVDARQVYRDDQTSTGVMVAAWQELRTGDCPAN